MATNAQEPVYQPTSDEMVIDTGDYDIFSSLDDLVVEDGTTQEKVIKNDDVAPEVLEDEVTENEKDDNGFDFDEIDDDDLPEEERKSKADAKEDSEDEEDEDPKNDTDEDEVDEDSEDPELDGDEEEVDYETHEITLPSGEILTLQEAIEGYRSHEAILEERENFEVAKNAFKSEAGNTITYLKLAKLEADRVIEDYVDFDWAELSQKDPQAYVENREFLDKYRARKLEIVQAMEEVDQREDQAKQAVFQDQARTCLNTLKAEVPGWSDVLYQDLMQYAIDNGTPEDAIATCVDASVFKVLNKARQFDIGKQVVKAKIKRKVGSPKKVVKSSAKSTKSSISNRDRIAAKLASGNTTDSDIFEALED